jgi:ATP-dependent DNA ligase
MRFADLVETSRRVTEARGRTEKIHHLAGLLRRLEGEEIDAGVAFLSGELRQGRIGIGWAALRDASPAAAAPEPTLALLEVDAAFTRIAAITGPGSAAERLRLLAALLGRATREEQDFLVRLVVGELRQGALAGIMGEALARAAEVPPRTCAARSCSPATRAPWPAPSSPRAPRP